MVKSTSNSPGRVSPSSLEQAKKHCLKYATNIVQYFKKNGKDADAAEKFLTDIIAEALETF